MVSRAWDLNLCVGSAAATLLLAVLGLDSWLLRAPFTLPLALIASGWALTAALHPSPELPLPERFTFALGLSLAFAVLSGVVLNSTPWGLRPVPWAATEATLTVASCALALRAGYARMPRTAVRLPRLLTRDRALFGAAVCIGVVALFFARASWSAHQGVPFTALSMVPQVSGGSTTAQLGIDDEENRAVTYDLRVTQAGVTLKEWPAVTLSQGQRWQAALQLGGGFDASKTLTATLYRSEAPDVPYRSVAIVPRGV